MAKLAFGLRAGGALLSILAVLTGCETSSMENEGDLTLAQLQGTATPVPTQTSTESSGTTTVGATTTAEGDTATGGGGYPAEIDGPITWLNTDVSGWAQTATLSASVSGGTINMPYSKARVWHSVGGLNANPWAIVKINGQWYAGTFEYFRFGQTSKPVGVLDGSLGAHFNAAPLSRWRPSHGERFGIMISGLARSSARNVRERSNISMVTWP